MQSKFAIMGHPLHPLLVTLPVGLFVWAFAADIVYLARDHEHVWYSIAFWSGIAAWGTALLAALPGFGDYLTMARRSDAAMIATTHMILNLVVVALFVVATLLMLNDNATSGGQLATVFILHLVGVGLLGLSGWLGGEMVYRHHLSIIPEDATVEADEKRRHQAPVQHPAGQSR